MKTLQFSLLSAIVMMIVASACLSLNIFGGIKTPDISFSYGYPLIFIESFRTPHKEIDLIFGRCGETLTDGKLNWYALGVDVFVALMLIVSSGYISSLLINSRARRR